MIHDWLARLFDLLGRAVDRLSAVAGYWGGIVVVNLRRVGAAAANFLRRD